MLLPRPSRRAILVHPRLGRILGGLAALTLLTLPARALTTTTTSIALSSTSITNGTALTLTATVLAGATPVKPGTVRFCDTAFTYCLDAGLLGSAQLNTSGVAKLKFIPAAGSHTYKAVFVANATYLASTSSTGTVTVAISGYHTTGTSITSVTGSAGNYTVNAQVKSFASADPVLTQVNLQDQSNGSYVVGSFYVGAGTPSLAFNTATTSALAANPRISASADFNGDGIPDITVASQGGNNVAVLLGAGDGTFTAASGSPIATGTNVVAVATGDINGDGYADIAAANYTSGTVSILLGNGDGTFQTKIDSSSYSQPTAIAVGDFNRDGNLDVAVTSQNSNIVYIRLGNGAGTMTAYTTVATGSQPYSVVAADLNADGITDLVIGNSQDTTVTVLLGNGSGGFSAASGSPVTVGSGPWSIAAADLNGDGKVDIVTANQNDSTLSILKGNGNGTFVLSSYTFNAGVKTLAIADFDNDGAADLAVCSASSTNMGVILGNGDLTFQTAKYFAVGTSGCLGLVATDLNGDGLPDIELAAYGNNTSTVITNNLIQNSYGQALALSVPGSGAHNIRAYFGGDTTHGISWSSSSSLTATNIPTALTLGVNPSSSVYGQQIVLTATLSPYLVGNLTTDADVVTFYNNGSSVGTGTLSGGIASLNLTSLPVATASLTASFPGDTNFVASNASAMGFVVSKATPTISWTAPSAITYGTALSATQLNATSGGVAGTFVYTPASGTVLSAGAGQALNVSFTPTATGNYNSANGSTSITVNKATPTVLLGTSAASAAYATSVTFTATVPAGVTGTVTFLDGASTIGTGTISGTTAAFSISTLTVGTHSITASWPGNTNYLAGVSSALTQTIVRAAATVGEVSTLNPSIYGDRITITITVSGAGAIPSGTVILTDGGTTLGTLTLDGTGHVSWTSSAALTAGSHSLLATYQGDTRYF